MKSKQASNDVLVITDNPLWAKALLLFIMSIITAICINEIHDFMTYVNFRPTEPAKLWVLAGTFLICLILYVAVCQKSTFVLNKLKRKIDFKRRWFLKTVSQQYHFDDVRSVDVQWMNAMDSAGYGYRVVIEFDSEKLPISTSYTDDQKVHCDMATKIWSWLDLPGQPDFSHLPEDS